MKKLYLSLLLVIVLVAPVLYGATMNDPIGGQIFKPAICSGEFYSAYPVASLTYVYDEAGAAAATSGQIPTSTAIAAGAEPVLFYEKKFLQVSVTITAVTSIWIRVEGRSDDSTTWADLYEKQFLATTTIDFCIPVVEHVDYLRLGVKYAGGTPGANDLITAKYTMRNQY